MPSSGYFEESAEISYLKGCQNLCLNSLQAPLH